MYDDALQKMKYMVFKFRQAEQKRQEFWEKSHNSKEGKYFESINRLPQFWRLLSDDPATHHYGEHCSEDCRIVGAGCKDNNRIHNDQAIRDSREKQHSDEHPIDNVVAGCRDNDGVSNDQTVHGSKEKRRNGVFPFVVDGYVIKKVMFWFSALSLVPLVCCGRDIRLMHGNVVQNNKGRIEILHDGQYGTICNNTFDEEAARVACRMLGFDPDWGVELYNSARFGEGKGEIWLDEVSCDGSEKRLQDCKHGQWGVHHCKHDQDVWLACFGLISDIRLVGGNNVNEGRVEIRFHGKYGTICGNKFDKAAARVVCRMLGFDPDGGVEVHNSTTFGQGNEEIWLDGIVCDGSEQRIEDCKHRRWGVDHCEHHQDVGVVCLGSNDEYGGNSKQKHEEQQKRIDKNRLAAKDIRLVGGNKVNEGRVEIRFHGKYGTICGNKFDKAAARVVCRMLGFDFDGGVEVHNSTTFGQGRLQEIWLDEIVCNGSEQRIEDCKHGRWGTHDCEHDQDVGVSCLGSNDEYGGNSKQKHEEQQERIDKKLEQNRLAGKDIRLMRGSVEHINEGRIEILHDGQYGTICNNKFDEAAARVACRMLGFDPNGGVKLYNSTKFGEGKEEIWLDQVSCDGSEQRIEYCEHGPWGVHHCEHDQDVGLACFGLISDIRLVGGNNVNEGRVEIRFHGKYGTICGNKFDKAAARVVCRMLGFDPDGGVEVHNSKTFGQGRFEEIWLDEIVCNGSEQRIEHCKHGRWGTHDCEHDQDVGVVCLGSNDEYGGNSKQKHEEQQERIDKKLEQNRLAGKDIRLMRGNVEHINEGRIEILHDGQYGTICNNKFDEAAARVACRMLGFDPNGGVKLYNSTKFGEGKEEIWLDQVSCDGSEQRIEYCEHGPWGVHHCEHDQDVGFACFGLISDIRLVGGNNVNEGRVEIRFRGKYGTICGNKFDKAAARVVCRMLGFDPDGGVEVHNSKTFGQGRFEEIWLDEIVCNGSEQRIEHCKHGRWGTHHCEHDQDVGVVCLGSNDEYGGQ
ncbi:hypothetical protein ScPMuIL_001404 [Solemya velum]